MREREQKTKNNHFYEKDINKDREKQKRDMVRERATGDQVEREREQ